MNLTFQQIYGFFCQFIPPYYGIYGRGNAEHVLKYRIKIKINEFRCRGGGKKVFTIKVTELLCKICI